MSLFVLSGESPMDLGEVLTKEREISYLPFSFFFGEQEFKDDMFSSMSDQTFYERMKGPEVTHTSATNVEEYMDYFRPLLETGKDIVHVTLSSGLTSTFQNARLAAAELTDEFPNQKIYVVDSICACGGFGLLMLKLADFRDEGHSAAEAYDYAEEIKFHVNNLFFSTDLTFYILGGRISKAAGTFAQALAICPFCDMDDLGYLTVREKIRTKKKVKTHIVEKMLELCENGAAYQDHCVLCHALCEEDAEDVKKMLEEKIPGLQGKIILRPIGPTIGAHSGPGTIALFFIGEGRKPSERSLAEKNQ